MTVEAEGLESRVALFPVAASKYSGLYPVAGCGLVWLRWPISGALGETFANPSDLSGRPTLEHFSVGKAKKSELVDHLDFFAVSGDGTRLVVVDEDELRAVPATEPGDSDSTVWIDARRILHEADPAAEWRQAYAEAGRLIRAYFWEPGMGGIDWDAVLEQYRPLVERVASPDEFADLLREVLGELGTSHAYVTAARRNEGPRTTSAARASSASTWNPGKAVGRCGASCPATPPTPAPAPRWPAPVSARARSSPMSTAARSTRSPAPTRCSRERAVRRWS
ncbi:hypothetical protein SHKM778_86710 [Streptomyces sp. KM77-8]|uniref:Tricorn protease C1 domain-containing protein n=1 Tax=Streptomyces haneummycinicus TaxID=3074435 RepID=A0AAT9HY17_9ACTN